MLHYITLCYIVQPKKTMSYVKLDYITLRCAAKKMTLCYVMLSPLCACMYAKSVASAGKVKTTLSYQQYIKVSGCTLHHFSHFDQSQVMCITLHLCSTPHPPPPTQDSDLLVITILDENDNRPVFTRTSYRAEIKENSAAGSVP